MKTKTATIDLKNIDSNPYRLLKKYPLDKNIIKKLRKSIKDHGFWIGVQVRKHPDGNGRYQAVFGHHRLEAARREGETEGLFQVVDVDSPLEMQKRLKDENQDRESTDRILEYVESCRNYLDDIVLNNDWNHVSKNRHMKFLFATNSQFMNCKSVAKGTNHVGIRTVAKALDIKKSRVEPAYRILNAAEKDNNISLDAVKTIPKITTAEFFVEEMKRYNTIPPKKVQRDIAKELISKKFGRRQIPEVVERHLAPLPNLKKRKKKQKKVSIPNIGEFVLKLRQNINSACLDMKKLMPVVDKLDDSESIFHTLIVSLRDLSKLSREFEDLCRSHNNGKEEKRIKKVASVEILD